MWLLADGNDHGHSQIELRLWKNGEQPVNGVRVMSGVKLGAHGGAGSHCLQTSQGLGLWDSGNL